MDPRAAVFDLDGVLFDVSERLKRCLEEVGYPSASSPRELPRDVRNAFWSCFLSDKYMHLDRLNEDVAKRVRELKQRGFRIVIITGRRSDTQMSATIRQLEENDVPFDEIFFRPPNCFKKDAEFKVGVVHKLLARGYEIVEVWDDSRDVIEALRRILPNARLVHYA